MFLPLKMYLVVLVLSEFVKKTITFYAHNIFSEVVCNVEYFLFKNKIPK